MQQLYRRTPMTKCDFKKVAKNSFIEITLQHGCSPVNLLHIFRTHFPKNTSQGLLLYCLHLLGAVALVKNVLLLVPRGKVLGLDFPNAFNKSLIKCGKIV